ncbi:MAG: FtsX-like permease family protein, partial [Verrucomicrobiota bacterium]
TALGGGRGRLVRQLLTESLLITSLGGVAGLALAWWGVDAIRALESLALPRAGDIAREGRVLGFALVATMLTGLVAGVVPALAASRIDVQRGLKSAGAMSAGGRRFRWRDVLIVGQLALSIVLLTGAGVLLRAVAELHRADLGFRPEQVLTAKIAPKNNQSRTLVENLVERVRALPGVRSVGAVNGAPMSTYNTSNNVFPVGAAAIPVTISVQADWRMVTADYFQAMQIPLRRGRVFATTDNSSSGRVAIVNETLARMLWGDAEPLGRQINPGGGTTYSTVVGVVGDVRSHNPGLPPRATYYISAHRGTWGPMALVVRTSGDAYALIPQIRAELRALDATMPLFDVQTMSELVSRQIAPQRTVAWLLVAFALLALGLAAAGLYGVMAHATSQRTREVGIRMALGAQRFDVVRPLLREGGRVVALGVVAGLVFALVATRVLLQTLELPGLSGGIELMPVAAAVVLLAAIGMLACYIPARRATKVDPLIALRAE